jgi:outer membrane protein TolC
MVIVLLAAPAAARAQSPAAAQAPAEGPVGGAMTIDEVVARALADNPDLRAARADVACPSDALVWIPAALNDP